MPEPTPEAWAQIRHDYEHTDRPIVDICAEHGISYPTLNYRKKRWGWRGRKPLIPREGPPPVVPMPHEIAAPPATEAAPSHPTREVFAAAQTASLPVLEEGAIVPRLQSAVARVLPAIEATIARLAAGPHHPREMEQAGRTLSSLTRTLRELNALLAEHNARPAGVCDCCDMPEDMDAFREKLARRIDTFLASRGDGAFEQPETGG